MDIDLVYLWVNGEDEQWAAKRNYWLQRCGGQSASKAVETGDCRYVQHDELKYSLRSVELYAPWIRRIFIVTDGQTPDWLDTSHPKIRIVSHSEIMPPDALPCFNSGAIEYCVQNIADLSEYYLLSNDDMYFCRGVSESFFFGKDGRPIARFRHKYNKRHLGSSSYYQRIVNASRLIYDTYGVRIEAAPHHNIDAYRKSDVERCIEQYRDETDKVVYSRFRTEEGPQRVLLLYHAVVTGHARFRRVGRFSQNPKHIFRILRDALMGHYHADSICVSVKCPDYGAIFDKYDPALFCINDDTAATPEEHVRAHALLEAMYPSASSFEKKQSDPKPDSSER